MGRQGRLSKRKFHHRKEGGWRGELFLRRVKVSFKVVSVLAQDPPFPYAHIGI